MGLWKSSQRPDVKTITSLHIHKVSLEPSIALAYKVLKQTVVQSKIESHWIPQGTVNVLKFHTLSFSILK